MQASDLRRLLELYAGWQRRLLPHTTFDEFIDEMEKLGKSWVLKVINEQSTARLGQFILHDALMCVLPSRTLLCCANKPLGMCTCSWRCESCGAM